MAAVRGGRRGRSARGKPEELPRNGRAGWNGGRGGLYSAGAGRAVVGEVAPAGPGGAVHGYRRRTEKEERELREGLCTENLKVSEFTTRSLL